MFFPKLDKQSLTDGIVIPQMVKVHQSFPHKDLADPVGTLKQQLLALDEKTTASLPGKRIGITAGSRGLPHYKEIMKALCDQLKAWGAKPFVFPAMGSHAGATAEGQKAHLAQFGINEDYLASPSFPPWTSSKSLPWTMASRSTAIKTPTKPTASSYSTKLNRIHTSNINTNQVC